MNVNEFCIENGEKVIWFEDGMYAYIAHAYRLSENDGDKEKEIIKWLCAAGVDFEK